jgi:G3E family GTPase
VTGTAPKGRESPLVAGSDNRFVFPGVHMLLDAREDRPWRAEKRASDLIFIGRKLDRAALSEAFLRCAVR